MKAAPLDSFIEVLEADPKWIRLLQILSRQLELFIYEGNPDVQGLYDALEEEGLVSKIGLQELRQTFALDTVSHSASEEVRG